MNAFMIGQIANMIALAKTFNQSCKLAASKDDGTINKEEEKTLKKLNTATDKYIKELEKLK